MSADSQRGLDANLALFFTLLNFTSISGEINMGMHVWAK